MKGLASTLLWLLAAVGMAVGLALAVLAAPALEPLRSWLLQLEPGQVAVGGGATAVAVLGLAFHRLRLTRREAEERVRAEKALAPQARAVQEAGDGILLLGSSERFVYANRAAARLFGHADPAELFGRSWRAVFPEEELQRLDARVVPALRRTGRWVGEVRAARKGGNGVDLDLSITALAGGGATWVVREASRRREVEAARARDLERHRAAVQAAGSAILVLSAEGEILECNESAERLVSRPRAEILTRPFVDVFVPEARRGEVEGALGTAASDGEGSAFETTCAAGGEERVIRWGANPLEADGAEPGIVIVGHDITERKRTEEALLEQEDRYRLLAHNSSDLVALHDPQGRFQYVSPSSVALLGYSQQELEGRDLYEVSHSDDWKEIQTAMVAATAGRPSRVSYRIRRNTGEYVWFETLLRPIRDEEGRLLRLQSSSRDVTERKRFEEELQYQALHEPLTGLPNRTLFMDRVNQALVRARREGTNVAVLYLDLDRFKVVNDSLGHATGDRLLAAVARRIRACLREADTVARLGGDEFGVLLEFGIEERDVAAVATRILDQLRPPFVFRGTEVFVTGSIGIAFNLPTIETAEDLLRYADVAMYRAKDAGPGSHRVFDPEVDARATRRLEMETALRRALEREELILFYQPIVALDTGMPSGLEALIRWRHPEWGMVGPNEFVPLAEESGLIVPIGRWVLERACRDVAELRRALGGDVRLTVSVNLAARQLEEPDLAEMIEALLRETGTDPAVVQLEITESELIEAAGRIRRLRDLGVRIAVDDFGTGYSSLSYLKNLPVDELKVDRSFVHGLGEHPQDEAIVQTVVTLAGALGLGVTAEGVETDAQLRRLRELGCGRGQGYHFARPAPLEEVRQLLASRPRW